MPSPWKGSGTGCALDRGALRNLHTFFAILQEWEEEDRQEHARTGCERQERAAKTIAEYFGEDVQSE